MAVGECWFRLWNWAGDFTGMVLGKANQTPATTEFYPPQLGCDTDVRRDGFRL